MQKKHYSNDSENEVKSCKLTDNEIRQFKEFLDEDPSKLKELADFVYSISLVLFKSFNYGPT